MTTSNPIAGAIATILAAFLVGGITYLVAVFTKESKVSDFRQKWIDDLRDDAAKFIGFWYYVASELDLVPAEEMTNREFWRSMKDEFLQIEILQAKIELRLNPSEHSEVIEQLRFLATGLSLTGLDHAERVKTIRSFSDEIQKILKSEWERVKRGEDTYRFVKKVSRVALTVALLCITIGGLIHLYMYQGAP